MIKDGFCFCSLSVRFRGYNGLAHIGRALFLLQRSDLHSSFDAHPMPHSFFGVGVVVVVRSCPFLSCPTRSMHSFAPPTSSHLPDAHSSFDAHSTYNIFFGARRERPSALATATTIAMRRSLMSLSMFGGCFLLFERECECGREGGMGECIHVGARWGAEG